MPSLTWNPPTFRDEIAVYAWNEDYAPLVHEGGVQRSDGSITPARRWTDAAIAETDILGLFQREFQSNGGNLQLAFENTAIDLGAEFIHMIESVRWDWDRVTIRSDGSVAGYKRDIVDSADLANSQSIEFFYL